MLSRRKTRITLLQLLYSEIYILGTSYDILKDSFAEEMIESSMLDREYLEMLHTSIHDNYAVFLGAIEKYSPKFQLENLPKIHLLILFIAFAEILFWKKGDIDQKISINEAIELAKLFSDASGAKFIN